jgi:uncharacterized protein
MPFAILLSGGLLAWSLVANLLVGDRFYVVRNLVLSGLLLLLARAAGLTWRDLGLGTEELGDGARWGRLAVAAVVIVVAVGAALAEVVPAIGALLADRRAAVPLGELVQIALIRIPLGTAVFEELAFRGLLLAVISSRTGTTWAIALSSIVFGLWHVAPTIVALRLNGVDPGSAAGLRAIVAAVLVTTLAGVAFSALRIVSGSLLAPVLAHWATNTMGLLAAAVTQATTRA